MAKPIKQQLDNELLDERDREAIKNSKEVEIPVQAIYKLPELQKYSKDYVRVLLPEKQYKPSVAINIVKNYFKEN